MATNASVASAAATEHGNETRLSELRNDEEGQTGAYGRKVTRRTAPEHLMTYISPSRHDHATEQDLPIAYGMLEMQGRGAPHAHENSMNLYEYKLLLYWAASRPVGRVHMATTSQRRACRGLRATWTLQCMSQLHQYELRGCRGCGYYPTSSTCSHCCTAWCHSCRTWSTLCWKCYRPRYSLTDTGEFMPGLGGPGGNGSVDTPV